MGILSTLFGRRKKYDLVSLNRDMEILNDCARLMESTVNPEVFFNRFKLYLNKLDILAAAESSGYINVQGDSFVVAQRKFASSNGVIKITNDFIDRMWSDTLAKARDLKTEKGKQNRYNSFYETLKSYEDRMPQPCIQHYRSLYSNLRTEKTPAIKNASHNNSFITNDTEYEAWLNSYKDHGMDFDTWKSVSLAEYAEDPFEKFAQYEQELRPLWDEYLNDLKKVEKAWSKLYDSKQYAGTLADIFKTACLRNIELYKKISQAENGHGGTPPPNAPAFKRLAMLYEKQGLYEKAALVCQDALNHGAYGDKMANRFERMIKKSNRTPSADEQLLIDKYKS